MSFIFIFDCKFKWISISKVIVILLWSSVQQFLFFIFDPWPTVIITKKKLKWVRRVAQRYHHGKKNKMNSAPVAQRYQTGNYQNSRNGKVEALLLT